MTARAKTSSPLWTTRGTKEMLTPPTPRDKRNRKRRCGGPAGNTQMFHTKALK